MLSKTNLTNRSALFLARSALEYPHIDSPALDAALLLAHAHGTSREKLYMELSNPLENSVGEMFWTLIQRRISGEPVAWLTGYKEFWGLNFAIGPGVLCPRPDSETLVETALSLINPDFRGRLLDCCCGPGTLGLAIFRERPLGCYAACDISPEARHYFDLNNRNLADNAFSYYHSDLLSDVPGRFDMIVSNPPYLTSTQMAEKQKQGWKEPPLALDGGQDGLDIIGRLANQSITRLNNKAWLVIEADSHQMPQIKDIFASNSLKNLAIRQDLSGADRVIYGQYIESK